MSIPLAVLAALSVVGGCVELPHYLGGAPLFSDFLRSVFARARRRRRLSKSNCCSSSSPPCSCCWASTWLTCSCSRCPAGRRGSRGRGRAARCSRFWFAGWGFDALYDRLFVRPFVRAAEINRRDFADSIFAGVAEANVRLHRALSRTETGVLRWYAMGIVLGAIVTILIAVFV